MKLSRSWLLLFAAVPALAGADNTGGGPEAVTVKDLLNAAKAEATRWADGDQLAPPERPTDAATVAPTGPNFAALRMALARKHCRNPLAELLVTDRLLQPFTQAGPEELRRLLPTLARIEGTLAYKPMVRLSEAELAVLNPPRHEKPTPQRLAQIDALQRRKILMETAIVKHNALVRRIRADLAELRLGADDRGADGAVLRAVATDLNRRVLAYTDYLAAIEAQVPKMTAARAKLFYDQLKALRARHGDRAGEFMDPAGYVNGKTRNSRFRTERHLPAGDLVRTINLLAAAARQPVVKPPEGP